MPRILTSAVAATAMLAMATPALAQAPLPKKARADRTHKHATPAKDEAVTGTDSADTTAPAGAVTPAMPAAPAATETDPAPVAASAGGLPATMPAPQTPLPSTPPAMPPK